MMRAVCLLVMTAMFTLTAGCKKEEPAPEQKAPEPVKQAEQVPAEEKAALTEINEKIEQEAKAGEPAPPPMTAETQKGMPAEEKASLTEIDDRIAQEAREADVAVPPVTVNFDASFGTVEFPHQDHAGRLACGSCHTTDPPGPIELGKEKAHELCRGCHQEREAGPTACTGCHQKG